MWQKNLRLRGGDDSTADNQGDVFAPISANDNERLEVDSLCMECRATGSTSILPTIIPNFGRIVVMAFRCPSCNHSSSEVQSADEIKPFGLHCILNVEGPEDMNRQVIKSNYATLSLPDMEFEIPPQTRPGVLSTVEGFIEGAASDLDALQAERLNQDPELGGKVAGVIARLRELARGGEPFVVVLDDPSGNSFIEPLALPGRDTRLARRQYTRSREQNRAVGLFEECEEEDEAEEANTSTAASDPGGGEDRGHMSTLGGGGKRWVSNRVAFNAGAKVDHSIAMAEQAVEGGTEVDIIAVECPACGHDEQEKIFPTTIPHFGKVILMSFSCAKCGYRNVEVKSAESEGREGMGKRVELRVERASDWDRMLLKSHSCSVMIPELDLKLPAGSGHDAGGGSLTTIEGFLTTMLEKLESTATMTDGDSVQAGSFAASMSSFLARFRTALEERRALTLIIDDPEGMAKVEPLDAEGEQTDPRLREEWYPLEEDSGADGSDAAGEAAR